MEHTNRADSVWWTLRVLYGIVPIAAGLDKFSNLLCDWSQYLAWPIADVLPFSAQTFMMIVGVIEIIAGAGVLLTRWTKPFALIVSLWLVGIAINLTIAGYYDVAVRDIGLAIGAWSLARLTVPAEARAEVEAVEHRRYARV